MRNSDYYAVSVKGQPCWKALLRVLVTLVPSLIIMLPYFLIKVGSMNIYICMFFKAMLPTFVVGFFLFSGALEYLFSKLGWVEIIDLPNDPFGGPVTLERSSGSGSGELMVDNELASRGSILERHVAA
mmetsp:Transcript_31369/g.38904  ORF Transcript_31369/g.38904 Transcript_31369/m.38904 type:complete len:128 (+) Transcript_31369:1039-1422(+)